MKRTVALVLILSVLLGGVSAFSKELSQIESKSVILVEETSGAVLFEKNADEKREIASVTKVMTALLLMEEIDSGKIKYDDLITTSEYAEEMGGSQVYLEVGEQMSVDDMLKALMIASGNDAAVAIAEHISGTVEEFVKLMNKRAEELGMKNTHFANPNGLPSDNEPEYSTARDVAIMSKELVGKHPDIIKYTTIWMDSLRGGEFALANTNKLLSPAINTGYDGATGLKTGFTTNAMHCLSATAKRGDLGLVAVVLGGPTSDIRFSEAKQLLDYGFNNFVFKGKIKKDEEIKETSVIKGKTETVMGVAKNDFVILDNKNEKGEITKEIEMDKNIKAPVEKGQKIGVMRIKKGDSVMGEVDIVAKETVKHRNIFDVIKLFFQKWMGAK